MLTLPLIWSFSLSDADVHRLLPYLILAFAMQPHANPVLLSSRVKESGEFVDYILLDPACSRVIDMDRFPRVLQGQEICSLRSFPQLAGFSLTAASENSNLGYTCPFAYTSQVSIHQRHKE